MNKIENKSVKNEKTIAEVLRLATAKQPVRVSIGKVDIIPQNNVRVPDIATWDIPSMAESLALDGQMEPVVLQKVGERFLPWRGFRRCSGVKYNAERGVIDPATGKPFESVLAFVIDEELTSKEQFALLIDGGNTRLLTRVELIFAVEKADKVWTTREQIAIALRGLLDLHFQPPADLKTDEEYAKFRTGAMDNLLNEARAPLPLYEACIAKASGKQKWPSTRETAKLYSEFRKIMDADKTNKINRLNPGKEWLKLWKEFRDKKLSDVAAGKKPKSLAMMTGENVDNAKATCNSRVLKTMFDIVKRKLPQEHLATLDALMVDVEAGKATVEQITHVLDSIAPAEVEEETADEAGE